MAGPCMAVPIKPFIALDPDNFSMHQRGYVVFWFLCFAYMVTSLQNKAKISLALYVLVLRNTSSALGKGEFMNVWR